MKSFLFSALALAALFTSTAQAQQTPNSSPAPANEWFEPAAPASADDDTWGSAPTTAPAAPAASEEATGYRTGWMSAPGISLSTHQKPTTDYWGRPLGKKAKAAKKSTAYATAEGETSPEADPMMRSSGVMVAPGMSSSPYRGVSTDYWGRPLKRKIRRSTASSLISQSAPVTADDDMPTSW